MSEYGFAEAIILGRVGNDPDLRPTASGRKRVSIRVAANRRYVGQDGNRQEKTTWVSCVAFGPKAENIAQLVTKGRRILIKGRLQDRPVEKDGVRYNLVEVEIGEWYFADSKPKAASSSNNEFDSTADDTAPSIDTEEIPF